MNNNINSKINSSPSINNNNGNSNTDIKNTNGSSHYSTSVPFHNINHIIMIVTV